MTEQIIKDMLADNEGNNIPQVMEDNYGRGYYNGYHDALVDLMNRLGISHTEEIYGD